MLRRIRRGTFVDATESVRLAVSCERPVSLRGPTADGHSTEHWQIGAPRILTRGLRVAAANQSSRLLLALAGGMRAKVWPWRQCLPIGGEWSAERH